ncbi:hypothetical protein EVAR_50780_1 [Eumeta japonica]|uniref:Uncharacterized protein n=1 Tax=Eumeta variegata TaxID=151549 RepID=A0A4C1WW70_EUMVA|nr:hypothetical protein EVAR_50780_1 [Eumeta japonica]
MSYRYKTVCRLMVFDADNRRDLPSLPFSSTFCLYTERVFISDNDFVISKLVIDRCLHYDMSTSTTIGLNTHPCGCGRHGVFLRIRRSFAGLPHPLAGVGAGRRTYFLPLARTSSTNSPCQQ